MPLQKGKSGLAAKLGDKGRKGFENHKGDETKVSAGGDLPAGIEGGIAQVVDCKFDLYKEGDNKGEYYFYAAAVVKEPKDFVDDKGNKIRVEGLRTSIMEALCETPDKSRKTVEEHLAWILNELRKMGVNTKEIGYDDLESVAAAIKESKPHIRFRTWKGKKATEGKYKGVEPRTQHDWRGKVDFQGEVVDDVTDETSTEEPSSNGAEHAEATESEDLTALGVVADEGDEAAQTRLAELAGELGIDPEAIDTWVEVAATIEQGGASASDSTSEEGSDTSSTEGSDEIDYDALGAAADEGDDDSITQLTELAEAAGLSLDDYPENWESLATALKEGAGSSDEDPAEPFVPKKGDVYRYQPKGAKKKIECEVTLVNSTKQVVHLKNLDDPKVIYKDISWDKLAEGSK